MKFWPIHPVFLYLLIAAWVTPGLAQIVSGGNPGPAPVMPDARSDERLKIAARFAEYFRAGAVGDAINELADKDALFIAMFGKDDWTNSPEEEKEELITLYVEAMNAAHRRGKDEVPEPVRPGDMSITEDGPHAARVGITFRVKNSPTRFMLRMRKKDETWWIVDGYAVGEDSWAENIRKPYIRMRGSTTPVAFIRQVHEVIMDIARRKGNS